MAESSWDRSRTYTLDEWRSEATRRFGPVQEGNWSFECPMCHGIQSPASIKASGKGDPNRAYSECYSGRMIGAFNEDGKPHPCDWKAYGLFRGPIGVVMPDGTEAHAFDFAPSVAMVGGAAEAGEGGSNA